MRLEDDEESAEEERSWLLDGRWTMPKRELRNCSSYLARGDRPRPNATQTKCLRPSRSGREERGRRKELRNKICRAADELWHESSGRISTASLLPFTNSLELYNSKVHIKYHKTTLQPWVVEGMGWKHGYSCLPGLFCHNQCPSQPRPAFWTWSTYVLLLNNLLKYHS